ncbi:MAG TPA: hypothetical protein VKV06_15905 [Acidimicrobiales bacterium]|nr:hypothetical protein [Acidimicrobiales bacterium]
MKDRWTVRWFRKRALVYHLLVITITPGCLLAGWWQVNRAMEGNTLSYLYAVEWPVFAILAVVGWWQLIHEDPAAVESRKIERARRAADKGPTVPPPPSADSGFYHPLGPAQAAAIEGRARQQGETILEVVDPQTGRLVPADDVRPEDLDEVHGLSSYNAYLARLAAGGGRKSWRNPHGAPPRPTPPPAERR